MTTTPFNDPEYRSLRTVIDDRDATYLAAYYAESHNLTAYEDAPPICPECAMHADEAPFPHITDKEGNILIGCEGYYTVDPDLLGLPAGNWSDFRNDL